MKNLLIVLVSLFALNLWAAPNDLTMTYEEESPYTLEPSFSFSSINDGSQFISLGLTGRVASWLRLGMEFDMPGSFNDEAQLYQARLLGRIMLLDRRDKVYLQGAGTFSVFNFDYVDPAAPVDLLPTSFTETFFTLEAMAGYSRQISSNWHLGARMGIQYSQYSPARAAVFGAYEGDFIYNRFSINGSYIF